jgi:ParB-like chromosome segregation protein Spo0J
MARKRTRKAKNGTEALIPKAKLGPPKWLDPKTLSPNPRNPRKHGSRNLSGLESSLMDFGQIGSIIVQAPGAGRNGYVIAGHGRLDRALRLGATEVEVREWDVDNATAQRFALVDNKTGEGAERYDEAIVAEIIQAAVEAEQVIPGFTSQEIDDILNAVETDEVIEQGGDPEHDLSVFDEDEMEEMTEKKKSTLEEIEAQQKVLRDQIRREQEESIRKRVEALKLTCPKCGHSFQPKTSASPPSRKKQSRKSEAESPVGSTA